jgi:hypothetical protein
LAIAKPAGDLARSFTFFDATADNARGEYVLPCL